MKRREGFCFGVTNVKNANVGISHHNQPKEIIIVNWYNWFFFSDSICPLATNEFLTRGCWMGCSKLGLDPKTSNNMKKKIFKRKETEKNRGKQMKPKGIRRKYWGLETSILVKLWRRYGIETTAGKLSWNDGCRLYRTRGLIIVTEKGSKPRESLKKTCETIPATLSTPSINPSFQISNHGRLKQQK